MDTLFDRVQSFSDKLLSPRNDDFEFPLSQRDNSSFAGIVPDAGMAGDEISKSNSYQDMVDCRLGGSK